MSIAKTYDVFCDGDGCINWEDGASSTRSASVARRHAKGYGWVRRRLDGRMVDLCPRCIRNLRAEQEAS